MLKANFASLMENSSGVASGADISIAEAGLVALQGILIVFSVLVILMIVLYIMKLFSTEEAATPKATTVASVPANAATTDETLAVISAAVAAMSGDDPTKRLRVVSVQEQSTGKYVWKK